MVQLLSDLEIKIQEGAEAKRLHESSLFGVSRKRVILLLLYWQSRKIEWIWSFSSVSRGSWSFRACGGLSRGVAVLGDRRPLRRNLAAWHTRVKGYSAQAVKPDVCRCAEIEKKHISSTTVSFTYSRNTSKSACKENRDVDHLLKMDYVTTNKHSSQGESQLYIFEDNKAVIKMIIKGDMCQGPTKLHLIGCLTGLTWTPRCESNIVDTKNQLLDMLTFTRDEWNHLLLLLNFMNSSMSSCGHFFLSNKKQKHSSMAMRGPEGTSGEGSAMAKPKFLNVVMVKPRLVNLVPLNLLSARKILRKM